jgi:hypothetical protein
MGLHTWQEVSRDRRGFARLVCNVTAKKKNTTEMKCMRCLMTLHSCSETRPVDAFEGCHTLALACVLVPKGHTRRHEGLQATVLRSNSVLGLWKWPSPARTKSISANVRGMPGPKSLRFDKEQKRGGD